MSLSFTFGERPLPAFHFQIGLPVPVYLYNNILNMIIL